jgi:hypothetical protein
MTNVYEWLENVQQSYAPTSPPFVLEDSDVMSADDITILDIDENDNAHFNVPHWYTQDVSPEQPCDDVEPFPIDPTLVALPAPEPTFVAIPEHLAEASSKMLIYLAHVLGAPEATMDRKSAGDMTFTAEELEVLEPINEEDFGPPTPSIIGGICVNTNPRATEIADIIDLRRVGPDRQTYYLARSIKGGYYWFRSPRTDRDLQLRKLIGEYRRAEVANNKTRGIKKLKSGKTVRI